MNYDCVMNISVNLDYLIRTTPPQRISQENSQKSTSSNSLRKKRLPEDKENLLAYARAMKRIGPSNRMAHDRSRTSEGSNPTDSFDKSDIFLEDDLDDEEVEQASTSRDKVSQLREIYEKDDAFFVAHQNQATTTNVRTSTQIGTPVPFEPEVDDVGEVLPNRKRISHGSPDEARRKKKPMLNKFVFK